MTQIQYPAPPSLIPVLFQIQIKNGKIETKNLNLRAWKLFIDTPVLQCISESDENKEFYKYKKLLADNLETEHLFGKS